MNLDRQLLRRLTLASTASAVLVLGILLLFSARGVTWATTPREMLTSLAWLIPAFVTEAIPIGLLLGAALTFASLRRVGDVRTVATPLAHVTVLALPAALATGLIYSLVVPWANNHFLENRWSLEHPPANSRVATGAIPAERTLGELWTAARSEPLLPLRTGARFELQKRVAIPAACFVLVLVGMGIGRSARRLGQLAAAGLGLAAVWLWYLVYVFGDARVPSGFSPAVAAWLPNLVLAVVALTLFTATWAHDRSARRRAAFA